MYFDAQIALTWPLSICKLKLYLNPSFLTLIGVFTQKIRLRYSRRFRKSPKTSTGETSNVTSSTATSTENVVGDDKAPSGGRKRKQNVLVHNQVYFILRCFFSIGSN